MAWAFSVSLLVAGVSSAASASDWPQWRGPDGQGHCAARNLPIEFGEEKNLAWRTEIPGRGWSSPVISGNRVWMTSAIEEDASEEEAKARTAGTTNNQPLDVAARVTFHAVAVDLETGALVHDLELYSVDAPEPIHELNSYASPSPIIEKGRLYCHFGRNGTVAVDTGAVDKASAGEGKTAASAGKPRVLWLNQETQVNHENGPGSTPVLFEDRLIVHCDGSDQQYLAAIDVETGKIAWKTPRSGEMHENVQYKKAYGTPLVVKLGGRWELLSPAADWLYSYDPKTGEELWKLPYGDLGFSIVPRPVYGHGMIYMATSFLRSEILAIRYDGSKPADIAWRYNRQAPQMPSPILVEDGLYFVSDKGGILTCLDAKSGEPRYIERISGNFASSPLYADGRIYLGSREGVMHVIEPGESFHRLAENRLDGRIFASPIAIDGALLVRTDRALYRFQAKERSTGEPARGETRASTARTDS